MAIAHYQPKACHTKPVSHRTLARFLETSVHRHSWFPVQGTSGNQDFYHRLISTTSAPTSYVVLGMLYMTKLRGKSFSLLCEFPGDLLFTGCLLLAFDILDDTPYDIKSWAILSGYSKGQINTVVRSILHGLDYRLAITPSAFHKYEVIMLKHVSSPSPSSYPSPPSSPHLQFSRPILPQLHPYPFPSWGVLPKDIFRPAL